MQEPEETMPVRNNSIMDVDVVNVVTNTVRSRRLHTYHSQIRQSSMRRECSKLNIKIKDALVVRDEQKKKKSHLIKLLRAAELDSANNNMQLRLNQMAATTKAHLVLDRNDLEKLKLEWSTFSTNHATKCSEIRDQWLQIPHVITFNEVVKTRDNLLEKQFDLARTLKAKRISFVINCVKLAGLNRRCRENALLSSDLASLGAYVRKLELEIEQNKKDRQTSSADGSPAEAIPERDPEESETFQPESTPADSLAISKYFPAFKFYEFDDDATGDGSEHPSTQEQESNFNEDCPDLDCSVLSLDRTVDMSMGTFPKNGPIATSTPLSADTCQKEHFNDRINCDNANRARLESLAEEDNEGLNDCILSNEKSQTANKIQNYQPPLEIAEDLQFTKNCAQNISNNSSIHPFNIAPAHHDSSDRQLYFQLHTPQVDTHQKDIGQDGLRRAGSAQQMQQTAQFGQNSQRASNSQENVRQPQIGRDTPLLHNQAQQLQQNRGLVNNESFLPQMQQTQPGAVFSITEMQQMSPRVNFQQSPNAANSDTRARQLQQREYAVSPMQSVQQTSVNGNMNEHTRESLSVNNGLLTLGQTASSQQLHVEQREINSPFIASSDSVPTTQQDEQFAHVRHPNLQPGQVGNSSNLSKMQTTQQSGQMQNPNEMPPKQLMHMPQNQCNTQARNYQGAGNNAHAIGGREDARAAEPRPESHDITRQGFNQQYSTMHLYGGNTQQENAQSNPQSMQSENYESTSGRVPLTVDVNLGNSTSLGSELLARYAKSPVSDDYTDDPLSSPPLPRTAAPKPNAALDAGPNNPFSFGPADQQKSSFSSFLNLF